MTTRGDGGSDMKLFPGADPRLPRTLRLKGRRGADRAGSVHGLPPGSDGILLGSGYAPANGV
jgi:hypothetical protein